MAAEGGVKKLATNTGRKVRKLTPRMNVGGFDESDDDGGVFG